MSRRAHVILPVDVVADIDKLVGKRGRSAFLAEVARDEIQCRQQRNALRAARGAWKDENHPELKDGSAAWVRQMRAESEKRFEQIEQHRRSNARAGGTSFWTICSRSVTYSPVARST